jgi:molybdopterin biosynthesis enzyme
LRARAGAEVAADEEEVEAGAIFDDASFGLANLMRRFGVEAVHCTIFVCL